MCTGLADTPGGELRGPVEHGHEFTGDRLAQFGTFACATATRGNLDEPDDDHVKRRRGREDEAGGRLDEPCDDHRGQTGEDDRDGGDAHPDDAVLKAFGVGHEPIEE